MGGASTTKEASTIEYSKISNSLALWQYMFTKASKKNFADFCKFSQCDIDRSLERNMYSGLYQNNIKRCVKFIHQPANQLRSA